MTKVVQIFQFIRQRIRLIVGVLLVIIGAPLYILPIPLGLFFIIPGLILIVTASPPARVKVNRFLQRYLPPVYVQFQKFCRHYCPECAEAKAREPKGTDRPAS